MPPEELNHPADDALRQALAEAERSGRLKSEFLDRISHRVRTAIQTVRGMSDLLRAGGLTAEQEAYLHNIGDSVEDLFGVVGEVVDFSKIETGSLAFADEDFYLKEALDHELYLLRLRAEEKGLCLTCSIDPDVPEAMSGDAARLAQALAAVVGNAIRYTARGGVDIEVMNGGYHSDGRIFVTFSVHDSGPGLSEKQLHALRRLIAGQAEPLSPHLNIPEGLGLGLAVACRLTRLLGGHMSVASDEHGTTFALSLPFHEIPIGDDDETEAAPLFDEPSPLFALNGAKILVAEDDPINRLLMTTILSQAGAVVRTVSTGQAALDAIRAEVFDAALMDVQLPEMDGLESARRIRQMEKELGRRRCPVLALTAHARQGDRGACLRAGMDEYCVKPIDKDELFATLGHYLTPSALAVISDGRHDMLHFLVEKGFRVTLAETARAALYEAALSHFDLILLDTQFLREDSLEITKVIRQLEGYSGRRAVIVGIGVDEGGEERCLIGGLDGRLPWPFSGDEFTAVMGKLAALKKA